ncbi:hypothetical protein J6590_100802 [Homalodisca vitripennis]|nr:hypothetical protein J6590_100802 [Homalodisca vitripennis]
MKDRRIGTEGVKCEHTCRGSWAENGLIVMRGALPLKFTGEGFQQRVLNGFINMPLYADYNDFGTQLSLGAPRAFLLTCSAAYWIINMLYMFIRDRYRVRTDVSLDLCNYTKVSSNVFINLYGQIPLIDNLIVIHLIL